MIFLENDLLRMHDLWLAMGREKVCLTCLSSGNWDDRECLFPTFMLDFVFLFLLMSWPFREVASALGFWDQGKSDSLSM
jgi:hypothetical protein